MEKYLGRKLSKKEQVHHIDFDKTNNDIKNLFLFPDASTHTSYHHYIQNNTYISPQEYMELNK